MMKSPKKLKLVFSDLHLGSGPYQEDGRVNTFEEFFQDHHFIDLLKYYSSKEFKDCKIEIIFNGDILDLLKVKYKGHFPFLITEKISIAKVRKTVSGHLQFFEAIKTFLKNSNRKMTYIVGNHDQEVLWPGVQAYLSEVVDHDIQFFNISYLDSHVYIEHGHMYDSFNRIDLKRFFIRRNLPEPVINIPYGSFFILRALRLGRTGKELLSIEVRPFKKYIIWRILFETIDGFVQFYHTVKIFLEDLISPNNFLVSAPLLRQLFKFRVFPDFRDVAENLLNQNSYKVVVFGHNHVYGHHAFGSRGDYLNTGTWTSVSSLELKSLGAKSKLTYACIAYEELESNAPKASLREWVGTFLPEKRVRAY